MKDDPVKDDPVKDDPVNGDPVNGGAVTAPDPTPEQRRALFRVVRGEPSDEEVAALTAVLLAAAAAGGPASAPASRDRWSDPAARMRRRLQPGPGAWRTSGLPR